jgi:photosystem II stability/assembly factor-like uncharacterized protein
MCRIRALTQYRWLALLMMSFICLNCHDDDKDKNKNNGQNIIDPPVTDWQPVAGSYSAQTVQSIKADLLNPATIYVGTLDGIYKSINGGNTWNACSTGLTNKDVTALAINPQNSSMLFCGTWGKGVFKSSDGGQSWQSAWGAGLTPLVHTIFVQNKTDGVALWVGTQTGLFTSDNNGTSWSQVQKFGQVMTVNTIENDLKKIVISIISFGFYRTLDGGQVWTATNTGTATDSYGQEAAIDFDPLPSQSQVAYALTDRFNLYKTTNGATSWQSISIPKYKLNECVAFAMEPDQPDQIWIASRSSGVYHSTNGGINWSPFNSGLENIELKAMTVVRSSSKTQIYVGTVNHGLYRYEK